MGRLARLLAGAIVVGCALSGCATGPSGFADSGPRSVSISHYASGERVSATYWRDGRYDPAAMARLSELFRDRRTGEVTAIDPSLIDYLVEVRRALGAPEDAEIQVTSGYRSPTTNATLARTNANVADNSYHLRGQAADVMIPGYSARQVAEAAKGLHRGGYAAYPHTGHVHVDTGPFRTWVVKPPNGNRRPDDDEPLLEARARPPLPAAGPTRVASAARIPAAPAAAARTPVPVKAGPLKPAPAKAPDTLSPEDLAHIRLVLVQMRDASTPTK